MTEQQWSECTDAKTMLFFLCDRTSDRKLRLFACACCRDIWHLLTDPRCREAVEMAERYADGLASKWKLRRARQGVQAARRDIPAAQLNPSREWTAYRVSSAAEAVAT